ncbi:MAG: DUF1501 domain-containing protein [Planctomycetota bacterium]
MSPADASPQRKDMRRHTTLAPSRREWLRVGGLGAFGLSLSSLLAARKANAAPKQGSFGRAKSCVLLFLSGGPPQHETFDPKPDAPSEVRGPFGSIATSVPGVHVSELLPLTAKQMHRVALIRSMTTDINAHSTSGAFMLSGYLPPSKEENVPPSPQDWPSIASVVGALNPNPKSPLSSVILPELIYNTGKITWPCQTGGFMGAAWHPQVLQCDPSAKEVRIEGLHFSDGMSTLRLDERMRLLDQLDTHRQIFSGSSAASEFDAMHQRAFDLLHSEKSRAAFDVGREPAAMRERYGRNTFGQSVLMARKLVESGVRLVQVNWIREPNETTDSPMWDTHKNNASRARDVLCPRFDQAYSALLDDLASRGLLDETLVVAMGEFGRSPKINKDGGRDHWGNVFSVALAGAGINGQVIGASDKLGGVPAHRPVRPPDLAATLFHLLGIDPLREFLDPLQRPRLVTDSGKALVEIVGE